MFLSKDSPLKQPDITKWNKKKIIFCFNMQRHDLNYKCYDFKIIFLFRQLHWNRNTCRSKANSWRLSSSLQLNIGMSMVLLLSIGWWMHLVPNLSDNWRVLWILQLRRKTLHWWCKVIRTSTKVVFWIFIKKIVKISVF